MSQLSGKPTSAFEPISGVQAAPGPSTSFSADVGGNPRQHGTQESLRLLLFGLLRPAAKSAFKTHQTELKRLGRLPKC